MFQKFRFFILFLLLVTTLSAPNGWAAQKVINWNYHTSYDQSYFVGGSHIQQWADTVWKETNHQLKINIFYNGGLGYKGTEIMSSAQRRAAAIGGIRCQSLWGGGKSKMVVL